MNTFEQSFAAEFEKIALSKTNIINAPTGKPRTFKSELGDLLTMGVGGGTRCIAPHRKRRCKTAPDTSPCIRCPSGRNRCWLTRHIRDNKGVV